MFPFIMIISTLIFFPENVHQGIIERFRKIIDRFHFPVTTVTDKTYTFVPLVKRSLTILLVVHFTLQALIPFRYLLYPGKLFWTEQGYRFSWRVMLMEKAGKTFFYVTDAKTGRSGEAMTDHDLTVNQEKMMSTQPDMILQYAHFLKDKYQALGIKDPQVRVECYVSLNGSGSRLFIDKTIDLTKEQESFKPKDWILPFEERDWTRISRIK
jgi:hypothetical protein